ncbi:unnamed protein product [Musa hybrid cultivar]
MLTTKTRSRRGSQVCCFLILLLLVTLIILYLTVFKPKQPEVRGTVVGLRQIEFQPFPNFMLNITLVVAVTIENPNYAGFEFESGTTLIFYRGVLVGQAPVMEGEVGARSTETLSVYVELEVSTITANPNFVQDIASGILPLESSTSVRGKVTILGVFKLNASVFTSCDITVALLSRYASATCNSRVST